MQKLWKTLIQGPPAARLMVAALVVLLPVAPAAATGTFVWDQDGVNPVWSNEDRWTPPTGCPSDCYPHTSDDDGVIDADGAATIYVDDDYTIDDLTFDAVGYERSVHSDDDQTARELSCDTVVLSGLNEVYVQERAGITAREE